MNKKYALLLAALVGAASAQAETTNPTQWYVGAAVGKTSTDLKCSSTAACDEKGNSALLSAGYDVGGLGLETSYINFGKFQATQGSVGLTVKPTAITLAGVVSLPVHGDWGVKLRLGAARVSTKVGAFAGTLSGSDRESKVQAYFGVGATYALTKAIKLELSAAGTEASYAGEKRFLSLWSLGASYAF